MDNERFIPYRNIDGSEIRLVYRPKNDERVFGTVQAKLLLCPETQGLRAIRWCEGCDKNGGSIDTGQFCKSKRKIEHPEWYSNHIIQAREITLK